MAELAGHTNTLLLLTSPPRIHMGWEIYPRQKGAFPRAGILADKISFFQESTKYKKKRSPLMVNDNNDLALHCGGSILGSVVVVIGV